MTHPGDLEARVKDSRCLLCVDFYCSILFVAAGDEPHESSHPLYIEVLSSSP